MRSRRDLVVVALATFCLTATVFMVGSIRSAGVGEYNLWADINNDGVVDIYDAILLANAYNTHGKNVTKSSVLYDSGWVNISDKAGQDIVFSPGLGTLDWNDQSIIVEITGKTVSNGGLLRRLGLHQLQAWNKTYGGTSNDDAWALVQTQDGGYALAGRTESYGAGSMDFWLVRTDADGNALWNKTYGGTGDDFAWALVRTQDGGFALAGSTSSYGAGGSDFWLVKTDANGNHVWNKTYGGTGSDGATALVQTRDGGYALTGHTYSSGAGDADFWLVRTDASGNQLWNATFGGSGFDVAIGLTETADGGYAMAGVTFSYGSGEGDAWLVRTDNVGKALWSKTYGGANDDLAADLVQTADGGYAFAGRTRSYGAGDYDFWLVRTDAYGNLLWNKTYGGTYGDEAYALVQTSDGGYALAGGTFTLGPGGYDAWLVKTDANGNHEWNKTYGGTDQEDAIALVQTVEGGYALAGSSGSYDAGLADFWLAKEESGEAGLAWISSSQGTITLHRETADPYWNYVRVRILKIK